MKTEDMLLLAATGAALYMVWKVMKPGGDAAAVVGPYPYVTTIDTSYLRPGDAGYGWKYYSDGTTIDPLGRYRDSSGKIVWSPGSLA